MADRQNRSVKCVWTCSKRLPAKVSSLRPPFLSRTAEGSGIIAAPGRQAYGGVKNKLPDNGVRLSCRGQPNRGS